MSSSDDFHEARGVCALQCLLNRAENHFAYNLHLLSLDLKISRRMRELGRLPPVMRPCGLEGFPVPIGKSPLGRFQYPHPECSLVEHGEIENGYGNPEAAECAIEEEASECDIDSGFEDGSEIEPHPESKLEFKPESMPEKEGSAEQIESSDDYEAGDEIGSRPQLRREREKKEGNAEQTKTTETASNNNVQASWNLLEGNQLKPVSAELKALVSADLKALSKILHQTQKLNLTAASSAVIGDLCSALNSVTLPPLPEMSENESMELI